MAAPKRGHPYAPNQACAIGLAAFRWIAVEWMGVRRI